MQKFIHIIALTASLVALIAGLWQGWGAWMSLQRMVVSYLAFYFTGALLALGIRLAPPDSSGGPAAARKTSEKMSRRP